MRPVAAIAAMMSGQAAASNTGLVKTGALRPTASSSPTAVGPFRSGLSSVSTAGTPKAIAAPASHAARAAAPLTSAASSLSSLSLQNLGCRSMRRRMESSRSSSGMVASSGMDGFCPRPASPGGRAQHDTTARRAFGRPQVGRSSRRRRAASDGLLGEVGRASRRRFTRARPDHTLEFCERRGAPCDHTREAGRPFAASPLPSSRRP